MRHWAVKYLGFPYQDNANGPEAFDCWGFVRHVLFNESGVRLPQLQYGPDREERNALIDAHKALFTRLEGPQEKALVLFHIHGRRPHLGICVDGTQVLHMTKSAGSVIIRLESFWMTNGLSGFYLPNPC